jgi:hypothetical protein
MIVAYVQSLELTHASLCNFQKTFYHQGCWEDISIAIMIPVLSLWEKELDKRLGLEPMYATPNLTKFLEFLHLHLSLLTYLLTYLLTELSPS